MLLNPEPTFEAIESAGGHVTKHAEPHVLRGVSVLSTCSHAGVLNAALGALDAFGGEPIDVILGGYHFGR